MAGESFVVWLAIVLIFLLMIALGVFQWRLQQREKEQQEQLTREVEILKQTVGALCSSAVGVDRRVNRIEQRGRDLAERQENIETLSQQDPPYAEAIRMVREGAGTERLIKELGLSQDAAELILMIHGMKS
jgi:biopolymer transport protein ExbB/TolQ